MHAQLQPYARLLPFLAAALGDNVEIALHDLSQPNTPIVAIVNPELSGRQIGDTLTNLGRHILSEKQYLERDYVLNYKTLTDTGKLIRSASYFIYDDVHELIGMLCINVNISDYDYLQKTLKRILGIQEVPEIEYQMDHPIQILSNSLASTIHQYTQDALREMGYPDYLSKDHLNAKEKAAVVRTLRDKGIFNMKGAIGCVAKELKTSEPTIYRYLKIDREVES